VGYQKREMKTRIPRINTDKATVKISAIRVKSFYGCNEDEKEESGVSAPGLAD
jgi:hypothetical protein